MPDLSPEHRSLLWRSNRWLGREIEIPKIRQDLTDGKIDKEEAVRRARKIRSWVTNTFPVSLTEPEKPIPPQKTRKERILEKLFGRRDTIYVKQYRGHLEIGDGGGWFLNHYPEPVDTVDRTKEQTYYFYDSGHDPATEPYTPPRYEAFAMDEKSYYQKYTSSDCIRVVVPKEGTIVEVTKGVLKPEPRGMRIARPTKIQEQAIWDRAFTPQSERHYVDLRQFTVGDEHVHNHFEHGWRGDTTLQAKHYRRSKPITVKTFSDIFEG